jgi:hypothetical protein
MQIFPQGINGVPRGAPPWPSESLPGGPPEARNETALRHIDSNAQLQYAKLYKTMCRVGGGSRGGGV